MGGLMDHHQQAVSPPWIHSVMVLEWVSHCFSDLFLTQIDRFRILYIPIRRHFRVIHQCLSTWHGGCHPSFELLTVCFRGSWTSVSSGFGLLLWSPFFTSMIFLLGILVFKFSMSKHYSNSSGIQINTHTRVQWLIKKRDQKVGNSIPGQYVTQTCGRQTPSIPPSFLMGIWLKINHRFPRFQQASWEAWTPPQHSVELRQMYQHPPRDAICCIESNIPIKQNIYFMDAD